MEENQNKNLNIYKRKKKFDSKSYSAILYFVLALFSQRDEIRTATIHFVSKFIFMNCARIIARSRWNRGEKIDLKEANKVEYCMNDYITNITNIYIT